MSSTFRALVIGQDGSSSFQELALTDLPANDVLVEVEFSSLNYKDGLAVSGNKNKVARKLPMVAGIDLAGVVVESASADWRPGDKVLVNGYGLSETEWGGYSRFQRVKAEWLVRLPGAFTAAQAMGIGTAGYTSALCVGALENWGITPAVGTILVTGASGGVGSFAVALLSARGFTVAAATGSPQAAEYLTSLGASEIVARDDLTGAGRPLQAEKWAGVIDSVGSTTLANALAQTKYGGAVAACGLAGGMDLPATVLPHILRGAALLGIDSVMAPMSARLAAWERLARDLPPEVIDSVTQIKPLSDVKRLGAEILAGAVRGRIVLDVSA